MPYRTADNCRVMDGIGARLRSLYRDTVDAPLPRSIADLIKELERVPVETAPPASAPRSEWDLSFGFLSA
jgi:hypothetical protein